MRFFDQRRKWRELAQTLERALEIERDRLGVEQANFVAELIAHNEFGLAHDQLVDALCDLDLLPLETTSELLAHANSLMGRAAS